MTYDQLSDHAKEIEKLAKQKYAEIADNDFVIVQPPPGCYSPAGACTSTTYKTSDYADVLFGGMAGYFDEWLGIDDGSKFQGPMDQLDTVLSLLAVSGYTEGAEGGKGTSGGANTWLTDVGPTAAYMQEWLGLSATNYKRYIAPRFGPTASNQFGLAAALRNVLMAEQALWKAAREDVDMIAEKAIEHLKSINGDGGGGGWSMTFTVIGAVVGVVGTVATGGTGAAIAWAAAGGATSLLGAAGGGGDTERTYPGGSPTEVRNSIYSALTDLNSDIASVERELIAALKTDVETAHHLFPAPGTDLDSAGAWRLVMPAPSVVTGHGRPEHR